jgi:hypothetical protein
MDSEMSTILYKSTIHSRLFKLVSSADILIAFHSFLGVFFVGVANYKTYAEFYFILSVFILKRER